jgi:hypothetical protein
MKSNSQSNPPPRHIGRFLLVALAAAAFGGLATALVLSSRQQAASAEPEIPAGANLASWFDNGAGGRRVLQIFSGDTPAVGVRLVGTVKSDSNCDPDALSLSHCHNIIELSNGRRIEIVNTHIMTKHPCLAPGDRVAITRLNENWVIASAAGVQRAY